MTPKSRLRWSLGLLLVPWIIPFFLLHSPLWKSVWLCMLAVYAGAFWLIRRSDIDTETGLHRASNVLFGIVLFQIVVVVFLVVFRSALTK